MNIPWMSVHCTTSLSIDDACSVLSRALFGGIPFVVSDARQEVPCRVLKSSILGFYPVFAGYGGEDGFELTLEPWYDLVTKTKPKGSITVEMNQFLAHLVNSTGVIAVVGAEDRDRQPSPKAEAIIRKHAEEQAQTIARLRAAGLLPPDPNDA